MHHEKLDKATLKTSGLDVSISTQGGLLTFLPSTEEISNQVLQLDHIKFTENYSMVLINTNRSKIHDVVIKCKESCEAFSAYQTLC